METEGLLTGWVTSVGSISVYPTTRIPNSCIASQKPLHGDISGTESGIILIDPLVSKHPEKNYAKKKERKKNYRNIII